MLDILKKNLDDFAAMRWDALAAGFADDVIYEELATRTRVQGADKVVDVLRGWKQAFPDATATVLNASELGDRVIAEIEWSGTQTGPLSSPFGTFKPTNQRGNVRAVILMTIKDGKIVEEHHYFDLLTLLSQIGAAANLAAIAQAASAPSPEAQSKH